MKLEEIATEKEECRRQIKRCRRKYRALHQRVEYLHLRVLTMEERARKKTCVIRARYFRNLLVWHLKRIKFLNWQRECEEARQ